MISYRVRLGSRSAIGRQKGVAAIEFALVFMVLFLAIYGIASVGAVLYVQQVVSRAAEDGARAALHLSLDISENDSRVRAAIYQSLASSSIAPSAAGSTISSKFGWFSSNSNMPHPDVITTNSSQITVRIQYPYGLHPVIPPLPLIGTFFPPILSGRATTAKPLP